MSRRIPYNSFCGALGAASFLVFPSIAHAQMIAPSVSLAGNGVYHYNYTITNTSADDLFDVSIHVQPGADQVFSLGAPVGFTVAYDSGLGLVDFVEDTSTFVNGTPISGFTYDSLLAPAISTFDANFAPVSGGIVTTSGFTNAAVGSTGISAVPEGNGFSLLYSGIFTVGAVALKRKYRRKLA